MAFPFSPAPFPPFSLSGATVMIDKLYKIVQGLNRRFPDGRDPFMMVTRLAEGTGRK